MVFTIFLKEYSIRLGSLKRTTGNRERMFPVPAQCRVRRTCTPNGVGGRNESHRPSDYFRFLSPPGTYDKVVLHACHRVYYHLVLSFELLPVGGGVLRRPDRLSTKVRRRPAIIHYREGVTHSVRNGPL